MSNQGTKPMNHRRGRKTVMIALTAVLILALSLMTTACTKDEGASSGKTVTIGWIPWDEDVSVTYLWKGILENKGYKVNLVQADAGPVFEGLSSGDIDLFLDAWLPVTHSDYWEQYGDGLEKTALWYDEAQLTWAVPTYVDVNSIEDLQGKEDLFNSRIIGIEPGAGLTRISSESVIPGYGLEGYSLIEGSTTAMLAELDRSISQESPVLVTLWKPHWAYNSYDLKDLEDPQGLLGGAEEIYAIGRGGFSESYPEVAEWMGRFKLSDAQLAELEDLVVNKYGPGSETQAISEWLSNSKNQALVNEWLGE